MQHLDKTSKKPALIKAKVWYLIQAISHIKV